MTTWPNCPAPPVCFLCRYAAVVPVEIVSRYAIFGRLVFSSTSNFRRIRSMAI